MNQLFKQYLKEIEDNLHSGSASEHTHRPALIKLIELVDGNVKPINEPKQITECGKPDISVIRGPVVAGYFETKDIGINLNKEEKSNQIKRYLDALPNLILTDYLEFRWFVNGELRINVKLATVSKDGKIKVNKDSMSLLSDLFTQFLSFKGLSLGTAEGLAIKMAGLARLMKDSILLTMEKESETGTLKSWLSAFEQTLIKNLSNDEFADMYSQTLTYGLFAAKIMVGTKEISRINAAELLPETNPFLRKLFYHMAGPEVPQSVSWVVEDLVSLFNAADMEAVLKDFGCGSIERDPIVHFYETFLTKYDPAKREHRGVYYTPEPVVSFIVRAVDFLLKDYFERPLGLSDTKTLILDPACGTGTFLHSVIAFIHDIQLSRGQEGTWNAYVTDYLLPRIYGFELLMAPYAIAHLKLGLLLKETGYKFNSDERLGVYLTNTLEETLTLPRGIPVAGYIAEETNSAAKIKNDEPIEVILGNPPYSAHSANASSRYESDPKTNRLKLVKTWIGRLIEDYKKINGQSLGEQNSKLLQDDYVKFLRWGQWRITKTGCGILSMITNHGYLDNPTFRGMRQQLLKTFNEIYLINLHGNKRKKERCPDGSDDVNVFDIQQGVAICIFIKNHDSKDDIPKINYFDLWGSRLAKYNWLKESNINNIPWDQNEPYPPFYHFIPCENKLKEEYELNWKITDIMNFHTTGVKTHRDHFVFDFDYSVLHDRIREFRDIAVSNDDIIRKYDLQNTAIWDLDNSRKRLSADVNWEKYFTICFYRPFDIRYYYHHPEVVDRPRSEIMSHIIGKDNLSIIFMRQVSLGEEYSHFSVCKNVIDNRAFYSNKGTISIAPLYLFIDAQKTKKQKSLFKTEESNTLNINKAFINYFSRILKIRFLNAGKGDLQKTCGPEDLINYIYSIFYSNTYRKRYDQLLRMDYPRIPITSKIPLFNALVAKGSELVSLHLFESLILNNFITTYPCPGNHRVDKVRYDDKNNRVYINDNQYFEGITPELFNFQIGGYQVLIKWLKDRKGRELNYDDLQHYQKIVVALKETIRLMTEIDQVIEEYGGWPIN